MCIRDRLNAAIMGNPNSDPFYGAPTVVVVLADRNIGTRTEDGSLAAHYENTILITDGEPESRTLAEEGGAMKGRGKKQPVKADVIAAGRWV